METSPFWREREARFKELATADGASDLHATRADVDLPALLDTLSELTHAAISAAINDPVVDLASVYGFARTTARAGRMRLDGEQADRWIVSGGPDDPLARARLQHDFRAEALVAAVGADEADATTTDQAALEAWFDLIVRTNSPHFRLGGVLEHLPQASADACVTLASQVYRNECAKPRKAMSPEQTTQQTQFLNRAAWLATKMETGFTAYRIRADEGPDKKTINRILEGKGVQSATLDKLAKALKVSRQDIPDN